MKEKPILLDWKHWIGWLLSAGGVMLLLRLFRIKPMNDWFFIVLLLVIVVIDVVKHATKLQ